MKMRQRPGIGTICLTSGILCLSVLFGTSQAAERVQLKDETARINYSVGYQIGGDFKQQQVNLDAEALVQGIRDAQAGSESLMPPEEMQSTLIKLKRQIVARQQEQMKQSKEKYRGEGREFLAENARKEGVVTLPSGLQYKVLTAGSGRQPTLDDTVTVNYRGTLIKGSEFDSSYRNQAPAIISLDNVIPAWKEALPLMKEGSRWQLFVPADLAFGERGPLADRTVLYEIELLSVQSPEGQTQVAPDTRKTSP